MEIRFPITALILLLATAAPVFAEDLVTDEYKSPIVNEAPEPSIPQTSEPEGDFQPPVQAHRHEKPAGPPPRFELEDRMRFRKWIKALCQQEAVNPIESARARVTGKQKLISSPLNKQGSLLLLVENYADDLAFVLACEQKRKSNPKACHEPLNPRSQTTKWSGGLNNWQTRLVLKGRDPVDITKEKMEARKKILKAEFFEFRDASFDGSPASLTRARKILQLIKDESDCRTRSVETGIARSQK